MPGRDFWQIGLTTVPAARLLLDPGALAAAPIRWLPRDSRSGYLADPFGLWRDGVLHLFAEAYDYRSRHGVIDVLRLDAAFNILDRRTCLRERWHLSYPQVFEADGATWLLPEAWKSGTLTLYRAAEFPWRWEPSAQFALDAPAIDPTLFRHDGLWWLAYAPGGRDIAMRQGRLHLASAERLEGRWRTHPGNPVRIDRGGARPGGGVIVEDGALVLPVQDCARSYGAALRPLRIMTLTPDRFAAELGPAPPPPPGFAGWHTLAQAGNVTLLDAKRLDPSPLAAMRDMLAYVRR